MTTLSPGVYYLVGGAAIYYVEQQQVSCTIFRQWILDSKRWFSSSRPGEIQSVHTESWYSILSTDSVQTLSVEKAQMLISVYSSNRRV